MPSIDSKYGPVVIAVASSYLGRYREFDMSLNKTIVPHGSRVELRCGVNLALNFNQAIRSLTEKEEYIWILGDDHVWEPDLLMKLLEREVDVVVPLCLHRAHPFYPVLLDSGENGYHHLNWNYLKGKSGLLDVSDISVGNAGMLIHRRVLEKMPDPWFEIGKTHPEVGGSDIYFCEKMRKLGIKYFLDTSNVIGHISHCFILPKMHENGEWTVDIKTP